VHHQRDKFVPRLGAETCEAARNRSFPRGGPLLRITFSGVSGVTDKTNRTGSWGSEIMVVSVLKGDDSMSTLLRHASLISGVAKLASAP
jgi:hypothetical protein